LVEQLRAGIIDFLNLRKGKILNSWNNIRFFVASAMIAAAMITGGCERKETILDVETPRGELEIERSVDSGQVDVDIDEK
jgi:hypothetical protein